MEHRFLYTQSELADFGADVLSEYMKNPGCCHELIDRLYSVGLSILYRFSGTDRATHSSDALNIQTSPKQPKHKPE